MTEEFIEEAIEAAADLDDRIDSIENLELLFDPNTYTLTINITLRLNIIVNQNADRTIDFSLIVTRD